MTLLRKIWTWLVNSLPEPSGEEDISGTSL